MDALLLDRLIQKGILNGKRLADIGCGTGRHWKKFESQYPEQIVGFDESEGMLSILHSKFPKHQIVKIKGDQFPVNFQNRFDIIISTLTLAHIKNLKKAMIAWAKLLDIGGEIIITDYHPDLLNKGGKRTFAFEKKSISIKNYIHPLDLIIEIWTGLGFTLIHRDQIYIDESIRSYYENKNSLALYEKFKGTPLIYSLYFRKGKDFGQTTHPY